MNTRNTIVFVILTILITLASCNEYLIGMMWGVSFYVLYIKSKQLWLNSEKREEEI